MAKSKHITHIHTHNGNTALNFMGYLVTGKNKTEAVAKGEDLIYEKIAYDYNPHILQWKGAIALIFRQPNVGWTYAISWPTATESYDPADHRVSPQHMGGHGWGEHSPEAREAMIRSAKHHLGTAFWDPPNEQYDLPDWFNEKELADIERQIHWQRLAQYGHANGLHKHYIHPFACEYEHLTRPSHPKSLTFEQALKQYMTDNTLKKERAQ